MANCSSAEEEAAAIISIQNKIQDLESQLQLSHDSLANLTGLRPAKRAKFDHAAAAAAVVIPPTAHGISPKAPTIPAPPPDARIIRHELQQHIETLQEQLKRDYFNGYEEQWETKLEWYESLRDPLQIVLDAGVVVDTATYGGVGGVANGKTAYLGECHEILKMAADSFDALLACGTRMDTREELRESEASFELRLPWAAGRSAEGEKGKGENSRMHTFLAGHHVENTWGWVWVALLRSHANHLERLRDVVGNNNGSGDGDASAGNTGYALDRYEKVILQCLRDMHGYLPKGKGCISMNGPLFDFFSNGSQQVENAIFDSTDVEALRKWDMDGVPDGGALAKLIKEKVEEWSKMKCDKKTRIVMTRMQYGLASSDDDGGDDDDENDDDDDDDDENDGNDDDDDDDVQVLNETYDESGDDGDEDDNEDDGDGGEASNLNESNVDEEEDEDGDDGNDELNETYDDFDDDGNDDLNETFEDSDGQLLDDDDNSDGGDNDDAMPGMDEDAADY